MINSLDNITSVLKEHFNTDNIYQESELWEGDNYPNEFLVNEKIIEVVTAKSAYENELEFVDGNKEELKKSINKNKIVSYTRLSNSRFFYREL